MASKSYPLHDDIRQDAPETFTIFRREIVGVVTLNPYGDQSPLEAAYRMVAHSLDNNDNVAPGQTVEIEFAFAGYNHSINVRKDGE